MRIAITGGTGFVGRHLARDLAAYRHQVVLLARGVDRRDAAIFNLAGARHVAGSVADLPALREAFAGCDVVAHCAGINREIGDQTYARIHVQGTENMVAAARASGVRRVVMLSYLRARPACGSPYHESKWAAEEIIRDSGLDYTILKAGVIYGRGDHMLDHLSHALHTFPVFPLVGLTERAIRPTAVEDVVRILRAALVEGRLSRQTVGVLGPEAIPLGEAVRRVGAVVGRHPRYLRLPIWVHYALAGAFERTMRIPLASLAQVRILSEDAAALGPGCVPLPADLEPRTRFAADRIAAGLPEPAPFGLRDLRLKIPGLPTA